MAHAVDEECRSAVDTATHAAHEIVSDFWGIFLPGDGVAQLGHRQFQRRRQGGEKLGAQTLLIFIELIVRFPEPFVVAGEFRRLGGRFRQRMYLRQREMPEHKSELWSEMLLHTLNIGVGKSAIRTFIVAIFHKGDRGIERALDVIT